jgi:hypothetical protein
MLKSQEEMHRTHQEKVLDMLETHQENVLDKILHLDNKIDSMLKKSK